MDGGRSMHSNNEERGAERLMDDYLKSIGLHRKKIAKDGSCLFRVVAEQVLHCQSLHTTVRAKCVEFLRKNKELYEAFIEGDFKDYLDKLQDPQQWVGEVEINALAVMYKRDFLIFQEPGKPAVNITDNNFKEKVLLCFLNGNHYDSVYPIGRLKNAALCQSILYELLYQSVFNVDQSLQSLCQRAGRPSDLLIDDNMAACGSSDESDQDAAEPLWVEMEPTAPRHSRGRGRGRHLPERVRRSLNPTLFRNIEYDVWLKTKRAQQKLDYCIAAGMQFSVADRCQVRLEGSGRSYSATVKEVPPNNGLVTVYIEELGKRQVPLWSLRPPSEENSWSTVVSRDKRLSNGHGDWEERGKGRGRGKHISASSSVSQTTALGSSGRVQRQTSWPLQATVEEQGGVKTNRKSMSSVPSAFDLMKEQHLVKKEEEMKVEEIDIQLGDEHNFPALGRQGDGGRKKGGERKRTQRIKTKSSVEDVRAPSPSDGERPTSSTPPFADPAATTTSSTPPINPTASPPDSHPARLISPQASTPNIKMSATAVTCSLPLTCAVPSTKTNTPSYASAAGATPTSPPAATAPSTKQSVTGGAVPPSVPSSATVFLTPVLPSASSTPILNALSSSSPTPSALSKPFPLSSSSLPPKSSTSPPPTSSLPPPTFIAPIAPSPTAVQAFFPPSSLPRSSLPVSHSPSPPLLSSSSAQISSSSSLSRHAANVHTAPAKTPISVTDGLPLTAPLTFQNHASLSQVQPQVSLPHNQSQISVSQTQTQVSLTQGENQTQSLLPPNQVLMHQMQTQPQPHHHQLHSQFHNEVASVPHLQPQFLPQFQSEVGPVQSSHPALEDSYPHPSQSSVPVSASVQPQPSVTHPHLNVQPAQPPHPSQIPHPSLSLSASLTHPSHQSQTPNTQNQTEGSLSHIQHTKTQASSLPHAPSQQSHLSHPSQHPHLASAHPFHPQSITGAVPLQQLSQLYQDPLYPGFPLGEKGDMAPTPPFSSSKVGDDLPKDTNILRFFFNLGVKAYSMPMFAPYMYLLPLQQAHTMQPRCPSRSPSPTHNYLPSTAPTRHQEPYPHPHYPPTSASMPPQYEQQTTLSETPPPSDVFNQAGYPVIEPPSHRISCPLLPWQQHQMSTPRNTSFSVGYPAPYPVPQTLAQGFHPQYPSAVPVYSPSSIGYRSSSEELQVSQGAVEQPQHTNGDTLPGQGPSRVPGSAAANLANANSRSAAPGFALRKEQGESLSRGVLLVDPPLNNNPILVSNLGVKDALVSMTTMKTSSTPGSPSPYEINSKRTTPVDNSSHGNQGHQKLNTYTSPGPPEPSQDYLSNMTESLSVGCTTEEDWEEQTGFKPTTYNHRGTRRIHRGSGRGRGSHVSGRGAHRWRHGGDTGAGFSYVQYNSSYKGRGRERGY